MKAHTEVQFRPKRVSVERAASATQLVAESPVPVHHGFHWLQTFMGDAAIPVRRSAVGGHPC